MYGSLSLSDGNYGGGAGQKLNSKLVTYFVVISCFKLVRSGRMRVWWQAIFNLSFTMTVCASGCRNGDDWIGKWLSLFRICGHKYGAANQFAICFYFISILWWATEETVTFLRKDWTGSRGTASSVSSLAREWLPIKYVSANQIENFKLLNPIPNVQCPLQ